MAGHRHRGDLFRGPSTTPGRKAARLLGIWLLLAVAWLGWLFTPTNDDRAFLLLLLLLHYAALIALGLAVLFLSFKAVRRGDRSGILAVPFVFGLVAALLAVDVVLPGLLLLGPFIFSWRSFRRRWPLALVWAITAILGVLAAYSFGLWWNRGCFTLFSDEEPPDQCTTLERRLTVVSVVWLCFWTFSAAAWTLFAIRDRKESRASNPSTER